MAVEQPRGYLRPRLGWLPLERVRGRQRLWVLPLALPLALLPERVRRRPL
jgi:hypothetical protein